MQASDPQPLVVVGNSSGQVLLVSGYGWYSPRPRELRVRVDPGRLVLVDDDRGEVGALPADCAGILMAAREVFIGALANGAPGEESPVTLRWDPWQGERA